MPATLPADDRKSPPAEASAARLPRYRQIYGTLKEGLESERFPPRSRLPSDRELVTRFGTCRPTVAKAVAQLVREGYLERIPGSGTYVTDWQARRAAAATRTVALVFPHTYDYFISSLIKHVNEGLDAQGCHVLFYDTDADAGREARALDRLRTSGADGVIAYPLTTVVNRGRFAALLEDGFPVVCLDRYFPDLATDVVATDNLDSSHGAVRALLAKGHQHIAFLTTDDRTCTSLIDRRLGYEKALLERGLPVRPELIGTATKPRTAFGVPPGDPHLHCADLLAAWRALPDPPTALFCANDWTLTSALSALRDAGLAVPDALEIAGFCDHEPLLAAMPEPLLYVAQDLAGIGREAARRIRERIDQRRQKGAAPPTPLRAFLPATLHVKPPRP